MKRIFERLEDRCYLSANPIGDAIAGSGVDALFLAEAADGVLSLAAEYSSPAVEMQPADVNNDGLLDLVAFGWDPAGDPNAFGRGRGVLVFLGQSDGSLAAPIFTATGSWNGVPALADFNGDGNLDLAVARYGADMHSGDVLVLAGNGDGSFTATQVLTLDDTPANVAAADLNGDGNADVVVAGMFGSEVRAWLGDGAGGFSASIDSGPGGDQMRGAYSMVSADFNADGVVDLALTSDNNQTQSLGVSLLFGNGDGSFTLAEQIDLGNCWLNLMAGDFNQDGLTDLAFTGTYQMQANRVAVMLNDAANPGQLQAPVMSSTELSGITCAAIGDFNADGQIDVAAAGLLPGYGQYGITILLGNGDGTLAAGNVYGTSDCVYSLAAGQFGSTPAEPTAEEQGLGFLLVNSQQRTAQSDDTDGMSEIEQMLLDAALGLDWVAADAARQLSMNSATGPTLIEPESSDPLSGSVFSLTEFGSGGRSLSPAELALAD